MPGSGQTVTGKVDNLWIGMDYGFISVNGVFLVLWSPGEARPFYIFEWYSLFREALTNDLYVSVNISDPPITILSVKLLGR